MLAEAGLQLLSGEHVQGAHAHVLRRELDVVHKLMPGLGWVGLDYRLYFIWYPVLFYRVLFFLKQCPALFLVAVLQ